MGGETFENVYADAERAAAYAQLDYPGTYYLAFRDLPQIIATHVTGRRALDFGCGAGRSTRFLKGLGFEAMGVDISENMIRLAQERDPAGTYTWLPAGEIHGVPHGTVDLVLCAFTFDNIPGVENRHGVLRGLKQLLAPRGRIILLASRPEIYWHEWASFTTQAFPENRNAGSGETVRIVMKDVPDARPVVDVIWRHDDYLAQFAAAGLELLAVERPLGREDEPHAWVSELSVAPWSIYVLGDAA